MARADCTEMACVTPIEEGVRCVVPVGGAFDAQTASTLRSRLAGMNSCTGVVLDFSHARDVSDVALVAFLREIGEFRARVWLRGLSRHHERLLLYLGLASGRGPSRERVPSR